MSSDSLCLLQRRASLWMWVAPLASQPQVPAVQTLTPAVPASLAVLLTQVTQKQVRHFPQRFVLCVELPSWIHCPESACCIFHVYSDTNSEIGLLFSYSGPYLHCIYHMAGWVVHSIIAKSESVT